MMFFIMLNVFLAILNDAYSSVQEDVKKEAEYEEWKYNRLSDEQKEAVSKNKEWQQQNSPPPPSSSSFSPSSSFSSHLMFVTL